MAYIIDDSGVSIWEKSNSLIDVSHKTAYYKSVVTTSVLVGDDDFLIWQNNFPYPAALSSVPEPNSLAILAISGLLMLRRQRT